MLVDHGIVDVTKAEERLKESRSYGEGRVGITSEQSRVSSIYPCPLSEESIKRFIYDTQFSDNPGTIHDVRELMKPLIAGMKNLLWCIDKYGSEHDKNVPSKDKSSKPKTAESDSSDQKQITWYEELAVQGMNNAERALVQKYFMWTLQAFKVFKETCNSNLDETKQNSSEYQHVLESFASSLSMLDSYGFQRIVGPHTDLLVEAIVIDDNVHIVADACLTKGFPTTTDFTSCLLKYFMKDAESLDIGISESDNKATQREADVKMKLFSAVISSLSSFPKNEQVLRPYLQELISICLRRAMGSETKYWPGNHLSLLQQIFRAVAAGKFEESYKEILPLLPTLLNGLYRIFCSTDHRLLKQTIIGLCLTVPARLSSLLPHLSLLLRIIVPALQSEDGDLINLG
jgi:transformation/transcription domain-associated protein